MLGLLPLRSGLSAHQWDAGATPIVAARLNRICTSVLLPVGRERREEIVDAEHDTRQPEELLQGHLPPRDCHACPPRRPRPRILASARSRASEPTPRRRHGPTLSYRPESSMT